MIARLLHLPRDFVPKRLFESCVCVFPYLGDIWVRAWPDVDEWLPALSPESFGDQDAAVIRVSTLPEATLDRLISSDLKEIYSVNSPESLARLLLAAFRHSELAATFFPGVRDDKMLRRICHAADYYEFQRKDVSFPPVDWFLGVGIAANEPDSFLLITEQQLVLDHLLGCFLEPLGGDGVFTLWPGRECG